MTVLGDNPVVPGRACGGCTLCCKVLAVPSLDKPKDVWCPHCKTDWGCKIYDSKPGECDNFLCVYLVNPEIDEAWKPSKSRIVLASENKGLKLVAYVDPARPDAWRKDPYYSHLRFWAQQAVQYKGQIIVCSAGKTWAILPDREVDLGVVPDDHVILTRIRRGTKHVELDAFTLHRDDPRAQEFLAAQSGPS